MKVKNSVAAQALAAFGTSPSIPLCVHLVMAETNNELPRDVVSTSLHNLVDAGKLEKAPMNVCSEKDVVHSFFKITEKGIDSLKHTPAEKKERKPKDEKNKPENAPAAVPEKESIKELLDTAVAALEEVRRRLYGE